eukprot:2564266-Amphidinium_carterae.1
MSDRSVAHELQATCCNYALSFKRIARPQREELNKLSHSTVKVVLKGGYHQRQEENWPSDTHPTTAANDIG